MSSQQVQIPCSLSHTPSSSLGFVCPIPIFSIIVILHTCVLSIGLFLSVCIDQYPALGIPPSNRNVVLFVSCNWYDTITLKEGKSNGGGGKARKIAELAQLFSEAPIVITGGIGRLSR